MAMSATDSALSYQRVLRKKKIIGTVAIALLVLFTVLAVLGYINYIVWVIADLIVAAVANLLLRRVGRRPL